MPQAKDQNIYFHGYIGNLILRIYQQIFWPKYQWGKNDENIKKLLRNNFKGNSTCIIIDIWMI